MARKPVGWRGESKRHREAALKGRRHLERDAMRWAIDPYHPNPTDSISSKPKVISSKLRDLAIDAGWISPMQDMVDALRKGESRKKVYGDYLTLAEDALAGMELANLDRVVQTGISEEYSTDEIRQMKAVVGELKRLYRKEQ